MSDSLVLHPALILICGALLLPFLKGGLRSAAILAAPLFAMFALWQLPEGRLWEVSWLDYQLAPLAVDKLSRIFATIFLLMAFAGGLFALRQESRLEVPAAFLYAGSAIGVALAGDVVTVFVFWEFMAVGSTLVLWSANTKTAWSASMRYAMVHLAGGVILFAGVTGHLLTTGDASFTRMHNRTDYYNQIKNDYQKHQHIHAWRQEHQPCPAQHCWNSQQCKRHKDCLLPFTYI